MNELQINNNRFFDIDTIDVSSQF
jgi:hypothetical protein